MKVIGKKFYNTKDSASPEEAKLIVLRLYAY